MTFIERLRHIDKEWLQRALLILVLDLLIIFFSYGLALVARFDFSFHDVEVANKDYMTLLLSYWGMVSITTLIVLYAMRLYHSVWAYAGVSEVVRMTLAFIILAPIISLEIVIFKPGLPRSVYVIGFLMSCVFCTAMRLAYRVLRSVYKNALSNGDPETKKIMIIGGGAAGRQLIQEIQSSDHLNGRVCCVIDDNHAKQNRTLNGVPVVGGRKAIPKMVERYSIDRIILAIPTIKPEDKREILNICKDLGVQVQVLPGMYQLVNGEVSIKQLRNIQITDLLGRDEKKADNGEVFSDISGKVIMVTGGGGSIGSELCRQIAAAKPKMLIIFDIYENNAYDIQQELKRKCPGLKLEVLIGSVRDKDRMENVMETYRPDIIYHAAAHKHVPLMEDSPNEAIKNNCLGTLNTARAAAKFGVGKFVMISTDKAVNPTNVMGASKRICEMIIQMMSREQTTTKFVAVRFGNVLGSNGSVIPLFEKQIAEGGPVTVTDKNIIRYFMTIQEAVSLVLQAGYYAKGGEIFVLDMGEPVKIDDMARMLIRLKGLVPDVDIPIKYVGLRPGEKLYEELLMQEEGLQKTAHARIFIGRPIEMHDDEFKKELAELEEKCEENTEEIREVIGRVVPTYHPAAN